MSISPASSVEHARTLLYASDADVEEYGDFEETEECASLISEKTLHLMIML